MSLRAIRPSFGHPNPAPRVVLPALSTLAFALGLGLPSYAWAGPPPGGAGPLGPGTTPGQNDDKDGPAEAAPKDKKSLAPIETVPAQPPQARRLQLFEFHGYLRLRTDYFNNLTLGIDRGNFEPATEFYRPPSFTPELNADGEEIFNDVACVNRKTGSRAQSRCGNRKPGYGGANIRLRMEPTIHVSDTIKVHATIDALDNLVLGSTPEYAGPLADMNLFSRSAQAPISGVNSFQDSLTVKRAWGHAHFGWGLDIKFGRMPLQWGLGMVYNDGNGIYRGQRDDIIRQLDTDYGDSIDSVQIGYDFGKDRREQHHVFFAYDWAATGPSTSQLLGPDWVSGNNVAQEFSLEQLDNVHQLRLGIERRDAPDMLERKLSLGGPVVNYGLMTALRMQTLDRARAAVDSTLDDALTDPDTVFQDYTSNLVARRAIVATPDIWLRVNWRTLRVELEMAGTFGKFDHVDYEADPADVASTPIADYDTSRLAQFGYALEFKYGFFDDDFHIGFDHGFALGDNKPPANYDSVSPLPNTPSGDETLTGFRFNPAYTQDLLMFKELLGTPSNTAYFRPWAAYHFFGGNFSARLDVEYALAHRKVATVGNKLNYGIEIDGALRYHDAREPIFVQLQYGVLFPFGGFNAVPNADAADGTAAADATAAQSVQAQIGIKF